METTTPKWIPLTEKFPDFVGKYKVRLNDNTQTDMFFIQCPEGVREWMTQTPEIITHYLHRDPPKEKDEKKNNFSIKLTEE